jgi:ATP-dependent DNA helicase RecG
MGYQAALMAPTEALAKQHYNNIKKAVKQHINQKLNIDVEYVSGTTKKKDKQRIYEKCQDTHGNTIVVGTHCVADIPFGNLRLAVIDEQQKFGVQTRGKLSACKCNPLTIFLTATPIPRTMGHILCGDIPTTHIDTRIGATKPTSIVVDERKNSSYQRSKIQKYITKHIIDNKKQAFVVVSAVEDSLQDLSIMSTKSVVQFLCNFIHTNYIGVLHGNLTKQQQEEEITRFRNKDTKILVCTSIVEVGIHIPDATLVVIWNAERFGASQLHQIRGRVGREPTNPGTCLFVIGKNTQNKQAIQRVFNTAKSKQGMIVALHDAVKRGPGCTHTHGNIQKGYNIW